MTNALYLTTTIPYVNARPHIGFALELVQADVLARHYRNRGWTVRLQTGSDENSLKNVHAAESAGRDPAEFVAEYAQRFIDLQDALAISADDFIRTSSDPRHRPAVDRLWKQCHDNGDLYLKSYSGLYCAGCEQFYSPDELQAGCCPEHATKPEEVTETNWFFRLSRYQEKLEQLIGSGELEIIPASRKNEVLSLIRSGLQDFSVSRSSERARGWGIPVPGDPEQTIYVWYDALGNYLSALGYGSTEEALATFWTDATKREHLVGKGVTRFHAVYWPAILLSAGLPLPSRIYVHGYVTVEGRKIGKSNGNAIDPVPLVERYGVDALRYFLLRHIRATEDGDFTLERLEQAYTSELAGQLGNLVHRLLSLACRYPGEIPLRLHSEDHIEVLKVAARGRDAVEQGLFHDALAAIWSLVAFANKRVAERQPWVPLKAFSLAEDEADRERLGQDVSNGLGGLLALVLEIVDQLAPHLPIAAQALSLQVTNVIADRTAKISPVFPKLE